MANTSGGGIYIQQQQQQQQHQPQQQQTSSPFQCKECGLFLDSPESLNVHLQYSHKENLLNKWSSQDNSLKTEENNNAKTTMIKREFPMNNSSSSENSDIVVKPDPEFNRTSPEHVYGHPPTPQSNHSSSPYQSQENSAFSPHYQNYQQVKVEQLSPNQQYHQYPLMNEQQSFYPLPHFDLTQNQLYDQEYPVHQSSNVTNSYRFAPYQRPQQNQVSPVQITSGHQVYPPQPTPSPSPQTCDKCGFVCNSASQLVDHINMSHPPTPAPHLNSYQGNQHYLFGNEGQHLTTQIKTEEQSDILDLDSHQVFSKDDKQNNSNQTSQIPHNVSSLVGNWSSPPQTNIQAQMQDQLAINNGQMPRFNQSNIIDQKIFKPVQGSRQDFMGNGGPAAPRLSPTSNFGAFDHLPTQSTNAVISTPQVPNVTASAPTTTTKSASWKSNEARRPKTYNCTACNKWFTSSGHLKRHYNTTLHKNAVKASGQPDPASLPISAHHHPARDNANSREGSTSSSPNGDSRLDDGSNLTPQYERPAPMPGHLQQPPNGPYDRQPQPNVPPLNSNLLHSPTLVSPMLSLNNLTTNGNSPNGEAGPSTMNLESRGLLPLSTNTHTIPPGFSMAPHLMSMEANHFQMYPNEEAPHVTQDMAISSLNTSGEEFISTNFNRNSQQLPSFDEIHASLRFGSRNYDDANVGGGVSATNPYVFLTESFDNAVGIPEDFNKENQYDDNRLTETDGIFVYPADTLYVLPESQYLDLANNNNLDDTKWTNFIKNPVQEAPLVNDDLMPDSTVQTPPVKEKPVGEFVCVECDKKFNKACYLTQHNKNTHSGEKPFKCTRCGKRYKDQNLFQIHVSKHGDDKPHKCSKCKKMFNHKTDLRRHMFCHAGVKPHYCETCHKGFIRKDHMLKHVETHKRRAQMKNGGGGKAKRR